MANFTVGVEEEFHLADADSHELRGDARPLVEAGRGQLGDGVAAELLQGQVETGTPVCSTLADVRTEVLRLRKQLSSLAAERGCRLLASGTYPAAATVPPVTDDARYLAMAEMFGPTARDAVACGAHVHVAVGDRDLAVAVLRRARPWLPVLLALTANSPFQLGRDTGYASFRSQLWARWPTAGPPPALRSRKDYDELVDAMLATGVLRDRGMLYWYVRASERYETLEFRVADVCLAVDDAVLLAGLVRALASTCAAEEQAGVSLDDVAPEVLVAAHWRAARYGLDGDLVEPVEGTPVPASDVVERLVGYLRPALEDHGDADEVHDLLEALQRRGTGAARQRSAYHRRGRIEDVLELLVDGTVP